MMNDGIIYFTGKPEELINSTDKVIADFIEEQKFKPFYNNLIFPAYFFAFLLLLYHNKIPLCTS